MAKRRKADSAPARIRPSVPARPKTKAVKSDTLLKELRQLIEGSRERAAMAINALLVVTYWEIGHRIHTEILKSERATYGDEIVPTLSAQLVQEFGAGFSTRNLFRMIRFIEVFPCREIVTTLSAQLGWSHFVEIIPLDDPLQRDFYAEMCRIERWSVRTLRAKVQGLLFERTALSKKPAKLAKNELARLRNEDRLTPDLVFRDPYFLDFLGIADTYSEADLEAAILRELEKFILELGEGFAFIDRQKRIIIDRKDYYLDLLFYHRKLRRLIAIELKIGTFAAADKGQMEFYLRWLEKYEREPDENPPLGLILCTDKSEEHIELLQLDKSGIRVATYLTELPSRTVLHKKLHQAVRTAHARLRSEPKPRKKSK
jgi:predicted nuclease of restriction endonuclease-like (RecB) superfamily